MRKFDMEDILRSVYNSHRASFWLKALSLFVTLLCVGVFFYMVFYFWRESFFSLLRFLLICGIPFLAVSFIRNLADAKRPFEIYPFYILPPREERGRSFPSRHAFSVFSIGTVFCFISPLYGAVLLLLGALMCVARVLLGLHFVRDILAGAGVGIFTSVIGIMIISPF